MDHHSGTGGWQNPAETSLGAMRSPKAKEIPGTSAAALSANAKEFVPTKLSSPPQPQQTHQYGHQSNRYRGDNNGIGGGGGGGGGTYNAHPSHYPPLDNGAIVNGTGVSERLNINQHSKPQMGGHNNYSDKKDLRSSSHYNHHQQHQNQHYPQHSQQQRLQQHHLHHQQQSHHGLHQNVGGPAYPFFGCSSTALNNHLHHPMLGGMAAVAQQASGSGGGGMMPQHDNRNKNNNGLKARLHNAQNPPMQSHHHQSQHHHQQHHQQQHHHMHQQQQHHGMLGGHNDFGADADSDQISENETFALDYLTEVIAELYDNPGMFDSIQRKLKGTFAEFRNNHFVLSNAVELIFEQSIKEQNFRYMGARLCKLLDSLDGDPAGVLWQLLSMKMSHQQSELHGFMTNQQIKVRGTTLFLAELYMQLRKPSDMNRNGEIAMRIIEAAKVLLSKEGPENIKCVCQCLKLCGYELERDRRDELLDILHTLGQLENSTDNSTGRFIRSVLDLQQKSWGRNEEIVPVIQPQMSEPVSVVDEFHDSPVFYGPDGQVMTQEENDFLETAAPITFEEYDDEEGDPEDLVDDGNMDLEIKLAFKEFVTGNNNRQNY
ncbi:uncharacterized protein LOC5568520 isoform X1 [Aedes aegypti]|uniref:Uncharacterized protein n=1 Tax=Aedes aegypti TaxID=7159 RepID=A0A6I8U8N5_AEDAE|nr:uncharacterized protein LOC5568520 isoform X1 [Aedes aegypti]